MLYPKSVRVGGWVREKIRQHQIQEYLFRNSWHILIEWDRWEGYLYL